MTDSKEKKEGPTQILSYLYIGNKLDAKDTKTLQSLNIKYILNCTPRRSDDKENGCPNYFEKEKLFTYKRIPIFDNRAENLIPHIDTALKFIEESRHYGNILVHCHKGISRSVSIVIGYLMLKNELDYDEALSFIQMFRPIAKPNESFEEQLRLFHSRNAKNNSEPEPEERPTASSIGPSLSNLQVGAASPLPTIESDPTDGPALKKARIDKTDEIIIPNNCSNTTEMPLLDS
jgi:protein-tyrosine phosphatase